MVFILQLVCSEQGWSVIEFTSLAAAGYWNKAWEGVDKLDPSVYLQAGGNGHSRTNTLWYIATRPNLDDVTEEDYVPPGSLPPIDDDDNFS